jgi:hypothetical protein
VSQIVWSPIAQGVLTGKYQPGQAPPEGSRATDEKGGADMIKRFMNDDVLTRVQGLKPIADEAGLSMAQLAVAWVLQNDNVAAALVGASRPEQVHENVKAAGVSSATPARPPRPRRSSASPDDAGHRAGTPHVTCPPDLGPVTVCAFGSRGCRPWVTSGRARPGMTGRDWPADLRGRICESC